MSFVIKPKEASTYDKYHSEWTCSECDTFDVFDEAGKHIGNFPSKQEAVDFIKDYVEDEHAREREEVYFFGYKHKWKR